MTAVGELVGYLRLDTSEWDRKAQAAKTKIDDLARKSPTVKVQADTATALAKLEAVRAATMKVQAAEIALNDARSKGNQRQILNAESNLITARNAATKAAIAAADAEEKFSKAEQESSRLNYTFREQQVAWAAVLATTVGPVLAAASALLIGFGAAAGVALVGFLGIKDAMKSGSDLGKAYSASFAPILSEFKQLKLIAAENLFGGINGGLKALSPVFGTVNKYVADFSTQLGTAFQIAIPGVVAGLQSLQPLLDAVGKLIIKGAQGFTKWSVSGGFQKFIDYAVAEMPKVIDVLGDLVTTFVKIVQASAPFGGVVLNAIDAIANAIAKMPVGVLAVFVPGIIALNAAMKGMAIIQTVVTNLAKFAASLGVVKDAEASAATAMTALQRSVIPIIGTLAAGYLAVQTFGDKLSFLSNQFANGKIMQKQNVDGLNDLQSAYQNASGVFGATGKTLLDFTFSGQSAGDMVGGLSDKTNELIKHLNNVGISTDTLKTGVSGDSLALADLIAMMKAHGDTSFDDIKTVNQLNDVFGGLTQTVNGLSGTTKTLVGAQQGAGIVIDGTTYAIDKQTTAAGLLKNALDKLNGTAMGVEDTENQFRDQLDQLSQAVKTNGTSLDQNSAKGRANREAISSLIKAANDHAQAVADDTAKTKGLSAGVEAGTQDFKNHEGAIRRAAAAAGLDSDQVQALINKIGKIPKEVAPKITIHMTGAEALDAVKQNIAALKSKQITISTYVQNVILPSVQRGRQPSQRIGGDAEGGLISGPGTGTSDSIPRMLSNGEFVVNAAATAANLPLLHAINNSPATARRSGGMAGGGLAFNNSQPVVNYNVSVNVAGSVRSDKEIAKVVVAEIDKQRRWRGDIGLMDSWSGQRALQQPQVNVVLDTSRTTTS